MTISQHTLNQLSEQLGRSLCRCGTGRCELLANDLGLCRALIRLLAQGQPVSADALARESGRPREDVLATIHASSNVELDNESRIVGAGLSLRPTPHRLSVEGRLLYAWCALDTLMYPPFLGMAVEVESPCAVTGAPVRARVSASGVEEVVPAGAVISIVEPDGAHGVRQGFCNYIHFFQSAETAAPWLEKHPGALLLSVSDAYLLGKELARISDRG